MLHGRTNESFHWKSKLDELDHLPGEPQPGKTAAWEKLQERMQEKQGAKKKIWYWMAAACLVMISALSWFILDQDQNNSLKKNDRQTSKRPMPSNRHVKDPEITITQAPKASVSRQAANTTTIKTKMPHSVHTETPLKKDLGPAETDTLKETLSQVPVISPENIDTNLQITASPVRKRLRVIHINELGDRVPTFRQDDHSSSISLSRNASDNIVKIKLTPSN